MDELFAALSKAGLPTIGASVLIIAAYLIRERIKANELKAPASDSDIKQNSAILKNLIEDLTEAKQREDDCTRKITAMAQERDAYIVREASLNRQIGEKTAQIDSLFAIMRRSVEAPGVGPTERELTRMRQWIVERIPDSELDLVAEDAGLAKPIVGLPTEGKALALIAEARQRDMLLKLENVLLAMRPTVARW